MFRLDFAVECLWVNIRRQSYVQVHFFEGLIPFKHLLPYFTIIGKKIKVRYWSHLVKSWNRTATTETKEERKPLWTKSCRFSGASFSAISRGVCFPWQQVDLLQTKVEKRCFWFVILFYDRTQLVWSLCTWPKR